METAKTTTMSNTNSKHFKEKTRDDAPLGYDNLSASTWATGYNSCLESTNSYELLDALKEWAEINGIDVDSEDTSGYSHLAQKTILAIKKATQ